jgi:hypothetical protein
VGGGDNDHMVAIDELDALTGEGTLTTLSLLDDSSLSAC